MHQELTAQVDFEQTVFTARPQILRLAYVAHGKARTLSASAGLVNNAAAGRKEGAFVVKYSSVSH